MFLVPPEKFGFTQNNETLTEDQKLINSCKFHLNILSYNTMRLGVRGSNVGFRNRALIREDRIADVIYNRPGPDKYVRFRI